MRTITLLDGEHTLAPPTFYALMLMGDYGVELGANEFTAASLPPMLAALMTDSEPLIDGAPARVWSPVEVAKLMSPASADDIVSAITELISEAFPDAKEDASTERPTKARTGSE